MGTPSMILRNASLLAALVFSAGALAATSGNAVAGKKSFESTKGSDGAPKAACTSCHGANGNAPLEGMPKLAGQYPDYLAKALREYRDGKRTNAVMAAQAKGLSNAEIDNMAVYLGSAKGDLHDLSGHAR
jgi:cytochrome c553